MHYRDWKAICALTDPRLKLCISLATDEKVLEGLQRGFPELFTREKPTHETRWPLSALLRAVEESCGEQSNDDFSTAHRTLKKRFGFPSIEAWVLGDTVTELPEGIMCLMDDEAALLNDMWRRGEGLFPRHTSRVTINGVEYYLGWLGDIHAITECYLYPCSLVDENS